MRGGSNSGGGGCMPRDEGGERVQGEAGPRLVSGQLLSRLAGELTARGNGAIPPAYSSSSSCLPCRHVGARR